MIGCFLWIFEDFAFLLILTVDLTIKEMECLRT